MGDYYGVEGQETNALVGLASDRERFVNLLLEACAGYERNFFCGGLRFDKTVRRLPADMVQSSPAMAAKPAALSNEMTNLAVTIFKYPEVCQMIKKIAFVGGSYDYGDVSAVVTVTALTSKKCFAKIIPHRLSICPSVSINTGILLIAAFSFLITCTCL